MKEIINCAVLMLLFAGCSSNKENIQDFNGSEGILYYEKPEVGSTVEVFFFPLTEVNNNSVSFNLEKMNYQQGVKLDATQPEIKSSLYSAKYINAFIVNGTTRRVYLIPHVKIFLHINQKVFDEKTIWDMEIKKSSLLFERKKRILSYRFAYATLDSIKVLK